MRNSYLRAFVALSVVFSLWAQVGAYSGGDKGFDISRMDTTCAACEDFYQYANGNWLKNNQIPPAFARWGSFDILADQNRNALREILDNSVKNTKAPRGSNEQLIADYYAACNDEAKIEAAGAQPIALDLSRINEINDLRGLQAAVIYFHNSGVPAAFGFGIGADAKNSQMNIGSAGQGGLSLPNKDYYTKTDEKSQQIRAAFVKHITNMFTLLGDAPAQAAANANTVMELQTKLAMASRSPVELRDPDKQYNKRTLAQLNEMTPNWSWDTYFAGRGVKLAEINVRQPEFFQAFNKLLTEVPMADWKTYLRWQVLRSAAPLLSKAFADESFNFYGRILTGAKEQQPRWRQCVGATDGAVGEALGQVYVAKYFTASDKARMNSLIDNLFAAFHERIGKLEWMSADTKKQAYAKLDAFGRKIAYPDKWKSYKGLQIDRNSYFANARRVNEFETQRNAKKAGKAVDRTEWGMTPPTVNAYYNPLNNEIAFPAGILRPPFFNPKADDAINYGGIGAVIGHEITHGFDDNGSRFDAAGNLRMWWSENDRKAFDQRAKCVEDQFSSYLVGDLNIQGKLVLGESIADLGGVTMAYEAFQKSMQGKPRPADIDGFTPEQRFFFGWAQVWAANARPEAERQQVLTDPHPAPRYRANGPLSNFPPFAAAFKCQAGDKMVRNDVTRCQIW